MIFSHSRALERATWEAARVERAFYYVTFNWRTYALWKAHFGRPARADKQAPVDRCAPADRPPGGGLSVRKRLDWRANKRLRAGAQLCRAAERSLKIRRGQSARAVASSDVGRSRPGRLRQTSSEFCQDARSKTPHSVDGAHDWPSEGGRSGSAHPLNSASHLSLPISNGGRALGRRRYFSRPAPRRRMTSVGLTGARPLGASRPTDKAHRRARAGLSRLQARPG